MARRWPDGVRCPECSDKTITRRTSRRLTSQYHCSSCGVNFTVKTGTIMHDSKLPLSKWALAFYLYSTNLKGISSMKLHSDLDITQKTAWHLAHRIRETWNDETQQMAGPVEVDETFMGGKERNKHAWKKLHAGRGTVGKAVVAGAKDRRTNIIIAAVVPGTDRSALQSFVRARTIQGATVYTDDHAAYHGMRGVRHEAVSHSVSEYVRGQAHTYGIESFWAMLKRGYDGVYHQMSEKHLGRYVTEFSGRHNYRPMDTADQMEARVQGMDGKRLSYRELVA